jgi:glyoxylase-like metal-dependent hydrolase (beta-lactamase superfamily II)
MDITRRGLLKAGVGLAAGIPVLSAFPAAAFADEPLAVGDYEVRTISDGSLRLPVSFALPDAPKAEAAALLKESGLDTEVLAPSCNVTLAASGDRLVLFDVGAGPNFQPTAGRLAENLAAIGVDPAAITDVVFTHGHPDHLWGLVDDFDELVFAEAAYHMSRVEWDYWRADGTLAVTPEERKSFVVGAQSRLPRLEDRIHLIKPGDEVVPGIEAMDTAGHTPGHLSFAIHGDGESLTILGDAIVNAPVSFRRPDWRYGTDQDPDKAMETRKKLLDRMASDHSRIIGFHLPTPGVGHVEHDGIAYRFAAEG